MIFVYAVGLACGIWGAETSSGFWFAWCVAFGFANAALILREARR